MLKSNHAWPVAAVLLCASLVPSFAGPGQLDGRLMGAWSQSASDCKKVFENRNGRMSLRHPVNGLFVAFIVEPRRIVATTGVCEVGSITPKGGYSVVALSCSNSIGFFPVTARLKVVSANQITYGSSDDPQMDVSYERCR